ncbi:MAG TPA: BTAD domain-containing putative transcriptional regulator [Armatimonadaceae bacterium]|nr:BTAD domain-containing putative transcriptional regulator [Armatimonadaceae bacterium]
MMLARDVSVSPSPTVSAPLLDIRLFGTPGVTVEGERLPPLRSRKGLYLLALLALPAGRERKRAYLASRLWPDSEESVALANLRRALTDLKSALGAAGDCLTSPTPRSLRLESGARVRVDVAAFDAACARGAEDVPALEEAIRTYGGPLLEGGEGEWIYPERLSREQTYLAALERLASARRERGEYAEAVRLFRLAVAAEPLRESAHRGLMEALARSGNFAEALQAYRDLRLALRREVNADPDPETRALYESLRARPGRVTAPAGGSPAAGGGRAGMPAVAGADGPVRLPLSVSGFIGRQPELNHVAEQVSAHRLVTLVGAGGVGKTRLAIESARRAAPDFPDGIFFVDLAPLADPSLVPQAVAAVLEVADIGGNVPPRDLLLRVLETRRSLIVLDNCEHLLAACAALADLLLRRCPHLRLVATSRQPLGLVGEGTWRVPPLSVPAEDMPEDDAAIAEVVTSHDATRLFVARATAVSPHFLPTGRQARAIVDVCRRLDGIALAIELAAARVRVLTVEQIAARLDDRFRLLTGGDRAALPRQQTLRALIDWSYDLLGDQERRVFERLSVFAGGWTLEAAEYICPGGDIETEEVLDLLSALVDRSLVLFDDTRAAETGGGRYRMQETIRQYAAERLAESAVPEADGVRDAHLAFYAGQADVGENGMTGGEQARWADFYAQEQGNLRAAWEWAVARGDHDRALIIPAGSWRYHRARGLLTQGRAWLEDALAKAESGASASARKRAHTSAGNLAMTQGDNGPARRHVEAVLGLSRETGDEFGEALAGTNLGLLAEIEGEHERARDLLQEHLPFFRRTNRTENVATALYNLSIVQSELRDWEGSREAVGESLTLRRQLDDRRGIAISLNHVALLDLHDGDLHSAWKNARECLVIARGVGHRMTESTVLSTLGTVALRRGRYGVARSLLAQSLRMFREMESPGDTIIVLENFAVLAGEEGDHDRGARLFGAVGALRERTGFRGLGADERGVAREAIRGAMGADRFERLAREGAAFDWQQATAFALEVAPPSAAEGTDSDPPDVL